MYSIFCLLRFQVLWNDLGLFMAMISLNKDTVTGGPRYLPTPGPCKDRLNSSLCLARSQFSLSKNESKVNATMQQQ